MYLFMLAALNKISCYPGCYVTNHDLEPGPPASTTNVEVTGMWLGTLYDHDALDALCSTYSQAW